MKVCDFCKTAMYWDKESALRAGRKSMDLPESSRFKVGVGGKIKGKSFTVLGRLSYAHEKGQWNEWFIETAGGGIQWLAEDEGELFLEKPLELKSPVPPFQELEPGMQIMLNDKPGVIEELGEAKCLGGEGQIPFVVEIGEIYPYADGSAPDGSYSFGLEYDTDGDHPTAFIGKILSVKDTKAQRAGFGPDAKAAEAIRCPGCGKPYQGPQVESTKMVVCEACGSALKLDEAETRVVGKNKGATPPFTLEVGHSVELEGTTYQVMGRLYYVEIDEGLEYPSMEYILHEPEKGYLWLSEENGHFTISWPLHIAAAMPPIKTTGKKVRVGKDLYSLFEWGKVTLRWVDGAIPWTATVGEKTRYTHLIKPPDYVDQEITGREAELFQGRYVPREEMEAACPEGVVLPPARGIYSCQPYTVPAWMRGLGIIGSVFLILNIVLLIWSIQADKSNVVLLQKIAYNQYSKEHLSKGFVVPTDNCVLRLSGSSPLSNSWLALDFAVVDANDRVLSEFWDEASYYTGRDSEGRWSEGSRSFSTYLKVKEAGDYRLLVHAKGGSSYRGPPRKEPVTLKLESEVTIWYYFILPILLSIPMVLSGLIHRKLYESKRWAPVMDYDWE